MKMRKWLPLVLAAGFAALSLAGCGGSEEENLSEAENNPQFNYRLGYDVTALGEPDKRYVEVEDSTYDYLAELKEEYGLSD